MVDQQKLRNLMGIYQRAAQSADFSRHFADVDHPGGPTGTTARSSSGSRKGNSRVLGGAPVARGERPLPVPGVQINPR